MSTTLEPLAAQGPIPVIGVPDSKDYPRLVFAAPYFDMVPLAELIEPAVLESIESQLPGLVPPYVQDAANTAVAQQAVMLTGSTMSGPLFLSPTMPTQPSQAASMAYVDTMISTAGVPEVPAVPSGQAWARTTGQWIPIDATGGNFLPISGGSMTGPINMQGSAITGLPAVPSGPTGAASAQWVQSQIAANSLYQGTYIPETNVPDLTQPATHVNAYTWITTTSNTSGVIISAPVPGLQGLTTFNGDNLIFSAALGQFQIVRGGGLSLGEAEALFLPLAGGQMTGALNLYANATSPMNAVPLQQVQSMVTGAGLPEAPTDGQIYGRQGLGNDWRAVLPLGGGVLTGALTLAGNATQNLMAVPFQQVNSLLGNYVPLAGGVTMIGPITFSGAGANLTLNSNASANLQAVPLQQLTGTLATYAPIASPAMTGTPTAPTVTPATDSSTTLANTAFVQNAVAPTAAVAAAASHNVGRNLLHNAMFNVQQRGAGTFTTNGAYTADRWVLITGGDTVSTQLSAASDTNRLDIGDETAHWLLSTTFTGGAAAGNLVMLSQRIEDVRRMAGKTVTVSFYANAGAANQQVGVSIDQQFGLGGSPSPAVNGNGVAVTLSSTAARFARYSLTFAMPSAAGKTFGTNAGTDWTALNIWLSSGSTNATRAGIGVQSGTVNIWGVQLEIGSVATPLEKLDPADDLRHCERFFEVNSAPFSGTSTSAGTSYATWPFKVTKRATPTITTSGGTQGNLDVTGTDGARLNFVNGLASWNIGCTASADL